MPQENRNNQIQNTLPAKRLVAGILAHVDAGKTTLAESILYLSGNIRKICPKAHQLRAFLCAKSLTGS